MSKTAANGATPGYPSPDVNQDPNPDTGADFAAFDPFGSDGNDEAALGVSDLVDDTGAQGSAGGEPRGSAPSPRDAAQAATLKGAGAVDPQAGNGEEDGATGAEGGAGAGGDRHTRGLQAALTRERNARREDRAELDGLKSTVEQLLLRLVNPSATGAGAAPPAPEPEEMPDPLYDPQGHAAFLERKRVAAQEMLQTQIAQGNAVTKVQISELRARQAHPGELVDKVMAWVQQQGPQAGAYFTAQADPVGAALTAYQREQAAALVGPDPAQFQQRTAAEVRAQVLAELAAAGVQLPPALQPRAAAPGARPAAPGARAPAAASRAPAAPPNIPTLATQPRGGPTGEEVVGSFTDFAAGFLNDAPAQ